ncbi:sulfurtransferase-like selenium metabolism protein YedF, partial [bacterium]|nr:sulfurtransferase-like selenium metabolism protein YedF [bacterium]
MKNEIDARGLPCPEPVVLAKKGIERFDEFVIIVND